MNCTSCGAILIGQGKFCSNCGAPVKRQATSGIVAEPTEKSKRSSKAILWILGIIGAIVVVTVVGSAADVAETVASAPEPKSPEVVLAEYEAGLSELEAKLSSGDSSDLKTLVVALKDAPNEELSSRYDALSSQAALTFTRERITQIADSDDSVERKLDQYKTLWLAVDRDFGADAAAVELVESAVRELVVKIAAAELENNLNGYKLLKLIAPDNAVYAEKIKVYEKRIEEREEVAKRQAKREKEQRIRRILSNYTTSTDKFNDTTFYTHKNSPRYTNSRSTVYLYIGVSGSHAWLRMKTQYASDDWLFVERVVGYADGETFTLTSGSFERDHNTSIWEWQDEAPNATQLQQLQKLANAKDATLRFIGSQYRSDKKMGPGDKAALKAVLKDFEELKEALKS